MKARHAILAATVACALQSAAAQPAAAEPASPVPAAAAAIAIVNGREVTLQQFERAFAVVARQKFYHRTPPEGQVEQARREVAEGLVDRMLLLEEARKRHLAVDEAAIEKVMEGYEKQYGASPNWPAMREKALPDLRRELAEQQQLAKLESAVRDVPGPDESAARAFYQANPALFTEPERVHLSVILLRVDPSSPKAVRDKAREEGREIRARLEKGADFAQLAKLHSSDATATKGGDLGYLHRGMLGEGITQEIDKLKPGEVSNSFDVLDGVVIFKLHERATARLRDFDSVRARAGDLLARDLAERAWRGFLAELRRNAVIEMKNPAWAAKDGARGP